LRYVRADLSPAENALHTAKRKEIYERIHPETKAGVAGGKAGGRGRAKIASAKSAPAIDGFTKATSRATGKSLLKIEETQRVRRVLTC
jgi:ParB family transcriptional regulator, chromosome partitioning protein